ncbi:hypothetical protein H7171_00780 [Candidatus Saccharibacteria bacterium]|nr:hypothetical protein [Candidatus Saccharibacteria bacterium]
MQSLLIFGRQPELGLAEIQSLYGSTAVRPVGDNNLGAIVDVDPCLLTFDRLGGAMKFCKVLTVLDTTNWKQIEKFLLQVAPSHSESMPEGKMKLGLSVHGIDVNIRVMEATGLNIKKAIRKTGRSVRLVPNKELQLNTAQVRHNGLTKPTGWELVFIKDGNQTIVAQTVKVQDIDSYSYRDRDRPKRDARVGMLPPKLAQIIINLAVGKLTESTMQNICDIPADNEVPRPILGGTVLDPFCGTGVLLQESLLMGYKAYGTDLEQRMVDYSAANLDWLADKYRTNVEDYRLEKADATSFTWTAPINWVACETYLGRPFTTTPTGEILAQTMGDCNLIISKFLRTIYGQIPSGTRLCLAVPAWQVKAGQFRHLPLVDQISEMGYNQVSFEHTEGNPLLYYRADQIVARELIVITKR